jgi:hypothetical protein
MFTQAICLTTLLFVAIADNPWPATKPDPNQAAYLVSSTIPRPVVHYNGHICPGSFTSPFTTLDRRGFTATPRKWELHSFSGASGQSITITVQRTASAMDPIMQLWSPTGVLVATRDDNEPPCGGTCSGPFKDPKLTAQSLTETGIYMIAIADYQGAPTGTLSYKIKLENSSPCCNANHWKCLTEKTYGYCPAGGSLVSPSQTCPGDLVCCPSQNNVYCVRRSECAYDDPSIACSAASFGHRKCIGPKTYSICDVSIQYSGYFYISSNDCAADLVCKNCGDGEARCVRNTDTC